MNITNQEIDKNYKDLLGSTQNPQVMAIINQEIQAQRQFEKSVLIKNHTACPKNIDPIEVASNLPKLKTQKLKDDMTDKFYDASMMEATSCIADSTFLEFRDGALASNDKLKTFLDGIVRGKEYIAKDPKVIGDESVYGLAMATSLSNGSEDARGAFVLKAPRSLNNADELIHEVCVAFYGTNRMRNFGIPNFAYVYGTFICNPPYLDPDNKKEIVSFCTKTGGGVSYAIYENIAPSISMAKYCETCTAKEFMYSYIQLMLALNVAHEEFDFTHYDLHGGNVLMREYPQPEFYVPFLMEDGTRQYCKAFGRIPTIIDYGMSHIVAENVHLGHDGASAPLFYHRVFRDRSFPLYDAYKLFMLSMDVFRWRNDGTFDELADLIYFFNKTDSDDQIFTYQRQHIYGLPYNRQNSQLTDEQWRGYMMKYLPGQPIDLSPVEKFTLIDWINHCRIYCVLKGWEDPFVEIPDPTIPILGCHGSCIDIMDEATDQRTRAEIRDVMFRGTLKAKNYLEFFDTEGLLSKRITDSLSSLRELETRYPQYATMREQLHQLKDKFTNSVNVTGLKKGTEITNLYNEYIKLNTQFQGMNPGLIENGEYIRRIRKYEAAIDEYNNMIVDFKNNFNVILEKESIKLSQMDVILTPFPIEKLPDYTEMLEATNFSNAKKYINRVIKFMDTLKRMNLYIFAMYKIYNKYNGWPGLDLTEFSKVYTYYNQRLIIIKDFTIKLVSSLREDVTKLTNPPPEDKQRLEDMKLLINAQTIVTNGQRVPNPYKDRIWYFNTYPNLNSFF